MIVTIKTINSNPVIKMKVGITFSAFDLLHAGHVQMLKEAKDQCDFLMVGLQVDPTIDRAEKNQPVQSVVERYIQLDGCRYVDKIIPYSCEQDLVDILQSYKVDIRVLGVEYKGTDFTGREYCETQGIQLYYNTRDHRFSSSALRRRVAACEAEKSN